jgi:hypothetical protein
MNAIFLHGEFQCAEHSIQEQVGFRAGAEVQGVILRAVQDGIEGMELGCVRLVAGVLAGSKLKE